MTNEPRVVLVGAGHAHLLLAREAERFAERGVRLALVDPDAFWYSGLATGVLAGMYEPELDRVDPEPVLRRAGAEMVRDRVVGLDGDARRLQLASGGSLAYDALSWGIGSEVDLAGLPGAAAHAWPVKPIRNLWRLRRQLESAFLADPGAERRAVVIGGGATGCEVAASLDALARRLGARLAVTLLSRSGRLAGELPAGASRRLHSHLEGRGLVVRAGLAVSEVRADGVRTADGSEWAADWVVAATGLRAPPLLGELGLPCGAAGGLRVTAALQVEGEARMFGAGDCIDFAGRALPRLGVFAVREAPVLLHNLPASLAGEPLRSYEPQRRYLSILNLGTGKALAARGRAWWLGRASLWLKDRIDRRFLARLAGQL